MTSFRIAPIVLVAMLSFGGCGGCGREDAGKTAVAPPPTTLAPKAIPPTTTTRAPAVGTHDGNYQLFRPSRWEAGHLVTVEAASSTTGHVTQTGPDGRSTPTSVNESIHATWVEKITAVDADGRRTSYLVYLRTWSRQRGSDKSIEGARLSVTGVGSARHWSFVEHEGAPTDEARTWLDEHFGSRGLSDEQWARIILPDEDVALRESWAPDPGLVGNEMAATGLAVDRRGVQATARLDAVEGETARCVFEGTLPMLRVPNTDLEWAKGGAIVFDGEMSVSVDPAPFFVSMLHRKASIEGDTVQETTTTRYQLVTDERRTMTPGGDFPEAAP